MDIDTKTVNEVTGFCDRNGACREGREWALQFPTLAEVYEKCERVDWMFWMLRKNGNIDKQTAVKIAVACAEHVLHFYEGKYPQDKRPKEAIEAAKKYIETNAADGAYAAARAADADGAYAAARAADGAYAAARATDVAADAAAYAAARAADADADAERKWQADKIREIIGENPFKKGV